MYASVWNRVGLLIAGLAFGWNLVLYRVAPVAQRRSRLIRLLLALVGAVAVVGLMGAGRAEVILPAFLVLSVSALVGYAGNARQSRVSAQTRVSPIERGQVAEQDPRVAIMLIHDGEPATYRGPAEWRERLERWQETQTREPRESHWFRRPVLYARIRGVYKRMGGRLEYAQALSGLGRTLDERLGADVLVASAYLWESPHPLELLASWAQQGLVQVLLVPIGLTLQQQSTLREQLTRSRAREAGLQIQIAPWPGHPEYIVCPAAKRFDALITGFSFRRPKAHPTVVADLAQHIRTHLARFPG